jgi:hypothetical protein
MCVEPAERCLVAYRQVEYYVEDWPGLPLLIVLQPIETLFCYQSIILSKTKSGPRQKSKSKSKELLTAKEIKDMIYEANSEEAKIGRPRKVQHANSRGQSSRGRGHAANICNDIGRRTKKKETISSTIKVRIV